MRQQLGAYCAVWAFCLHPAPKCAISGPQQCAIKGAPMLQAYFATRPLARKIWIAGLSAAWLLCWPAVLLLGGCEIAREMNRHDTREFWRQQDNKLPLDLAEAQDELRSVGF